MFITKLLEDFDNLDTVFGRVQEYPLIHLSSDKDKMVLRAEMPGIAEENIDISVTEDVIEISGKSAGGKKEEGFRQTRQERWSGEFTRSIELPFEVDQKKIKASLKHGILTILLPIREQSKAKKIAVKVGS